MPYASVAASATLSSFFGMASKAHTEPAATRSLRLSSSLAPSNESLLTEWTWTGLLANSRLLRGLSWGVSCLRTDCRENQDGWAVQVYACTLAPPQSPLSSVTRVASEPPGSASDAGGTPLGPIPTAPPGPGAVLDFLPTFSFSWSHELTSLNTQLRPAASSARASPRHTEPRETFIGSATFVVLDGHGAGGRDAAAAIEKAFDSVFSRVLGDNGAQDLLSPTRLLDSVAESLRSGQRLIEKLNADTQSDFGTTCVSVTLVNDLLISTSCGDSTALLLAFPPGDWSGPRRTLPLVVELSRRHSLEDRDELKRIADDGRGRVIRGDGGVLRLIPGDIKYDEAKRRGLSINMGRSLGHAVFKDCGLSTEVDFSFLALKQLPKLLGSAVYGLPRRALVPSRCFRLPPLSLPECRKLVDQFSLAAHSRTKSMCELLRRRPSSTLDPDENLPPANLPEEPPDLGPKPTKTNALLRCFTRKASASSDPAPPSPAVSAPPARLDEAVPPAAKMGDVFVLLMSDGVTDVLSSTCIVDMLKEFDQKWRGKKRAFDPSAFALTLTQVARER